VLRNSCSAPENDDRFSAELSAARKRVLVADDQTRMLEVVTNLLEESFDVIGLVSDGRAALEEVLALEPDLVVLDVSMPGMSGIGVAKELRQRSNTAIIVFLTVHEDAQIMASCLAAGGSGYIVKEFMDSDLIFALNEALAGRVFVSRFLEQ
jgi:DNA-binding NarL/FixJ family response regulator